jgi:hypothetical protein
MAPLGAALKLQSICEAVVAVELHRIPEIGSSVLQEFPAVKEGMACLKRLE